MGRRNLGRGWTSMMWGAFDCECVSAKWAVCGFVLMTYSPARQSTIYPTETTYFQAIDL